MIIKNKRIIILFLLVIFFSCSDGKNTSDPDPETAKWGSAKWGEGTWNE